METQLSQFFCGLIFGSIRRLCPRGILSLQCFNQDREQKSALRFLLRASKTQKNELLNRFQSSHRNPRLSSHSHPAVLSEREKHKRSAFTATTALNQLHSLSCRHVTLQAGASDGSLHDRCVSKIKTEAPENIKLGLVSVLYRCGGDTMHLQRTV